MFFITHTNEKTMKYFTKEWYELMQRLHYTVGMQPIADKEYSDEEIAALYDKKITAAIERAHTGYDKPPQFLPIDFDACELDDFCTYDTETETLKRPASMDDVRRGFEEKKARAYEEFKNRPPFNADDTIKTFETIYRNTLEHGYLRFPEWVKEKADIRLIALGYLPKSIYKKLEKEEKKNRKKFDKINRKAEKALESERKNIPESILSQFGFHDCSVLSLEQSDSGLCMIIREDGVPYEDETPYTRVTFSNGVLIERDEKLSFASRVDKTDDETEELSGCDWLYDELYKTEHGYEAHMLFACGKLCYLTIVCDDIVIEKNISI